jgi:hypothetical protein
MEEDMNKITMRISRGTLSLRAVLCLLCVFALGVGISRAQSAPNTNSVLILGSTAQNAATGIEAYQAAQAGFTVVVASDTDWSAMSTADFASYLEIVFADGMCSGSATLRAALANQAVWGPAVTGNVIVLGDHPGMSSLGTAPVQSFVETPVMSFVQTALGFAAAGHGTGAYINLACYMSTATPTAAAVLKPFGQFSVVQQNGCSAGSYLVASDPNLSALNDTNMSGWSCTSDAEFLKWDSTFVPLMVATNVSGQFTDTSTGANVSPYMLVRGAQTTTLTTLQALPTAPPVPPPSVPGDPTGDISMPMSGSQDLGSSSFVLGDSTWGLTGSADVNLSWTPNSDIAVQYDSTLVQQGASPGTTDTLTPGDGNLCLGFNASLGANVDGTSVGVASYSQSICGDCPLNPDGSSSCSLGEQMIPLFCLSVVVGDACMNLTVTPTTTVNPGPFQTDRTVVYSGTPGTGPNTLSFPPDPQADPITVSCTEPVGTDVVYQLANPRDSAPFSNFEVGLGVAATVTVGVCPLCTTGTVYDSGPVFTIPVPVGGVTLPLTGSGGQVDLGNVLKEMAIPDLTNVLASYLGNEGSPIQFSSAGAKDPCLNYDSLVWNFSDEGVAYGSNPYHTFQDPAIFSGQLVVTNVGGVQATKALTITVNDVPPVVTAGPNTTALWGVPVAFNGSATAGGTGEQATLVYSWSFGDGSPSATGGPSVMHAYSAPGTYTSTLNVCDVDSNCSSSSLQVVVNKRNVSLGYLGAQQGVYNTLTNLSGSLVDQLGSAVPGRTIVFAIGAEAGGSAATNSSGTASTTPLLTLGAGSYLASATFAGDSLYNAAAPSTAAYTVSQKPTSVAYTGALAGGPNKTITLSAVLVDSQNNPLAGRVIAFKLGSQSASATTNASGVAATTLKLDQKNASYALTATFTPVGADASLYLGSVASATFILGGGK